MAAIDLKKSITAIPRAAGYTVGQDVPLASIRTDGGTQARAGLDDVTVGEYAHMMLEGAAFPLIVVYHDGTDHWLADGFHRVAAAGRAGLTALRAEIRQGTRRDAVLHACGANASHGVRRTQADKRRAIETLLRDDEWRQWSDSEIARRCNVSDKTVASVRFDLYPRNSEDSRTVERNGTTYQQKPPARPAEPTTTEPTIPIPPDDLRKAGVGLTRHGSWWIAVGYSGEMNNWTSGNAQPWDLAVAAAREEIAKRTVLALPEPPATPDLADILKRLDAHGYAKTSTRQKGMTTFYSFRDYRSTLDDGQAGELELAEGELPIWLAELDSNAAYAQAKQEKYLSEQARAARLGYDLRRDGARFMLTPTGKQVPALVGTLDSLIKTVDGYEQNAAKQVAAEPALTIEQLDDCLPKGYERRGYFWVTATPPTLGHIDGWRGDAPTIAGAISQAADREQRKSRVDAPTRTDVQRAAESFAALSGDHDPEQQPKGEYPFWDDTAIALDLVYTSVEEHNRVEAIDRCMSLLMGLVAGRRDDIMLKAWWFFTRMLFDPDVLTDLPLGEATPRRDAVLLLRQIAPLLQDVQATDLEGLSQAISDLNECPEGTEAAHWLTVGYALLDREKD